MKKSRILGEVEIASHVSDESLELYVLDRLTELEWCRLEEHIQVCGECRTRLKDTSGYVEAIRAALIQDRISRL